MKKIISLFLILCMVLSLAACGGPKFQPDTPSSTQSGLRENQPDSQSTEAPTGPGTEAPEKISYTAQYMEAPTPGTEPTAPEEPQKIGSEGCGLNIWPTLLNCGDPEVMRSDNGAYSVSVYPHTEGPIQAEVTFSRYIDPQNKSPEDYSFVFMILADGVPMEFTVTGACETDDPENDEAMVFVEDGERYLQYPLSVGEDYVVLNLEFEPEFDLNLGRLDFITLFTGNDDWSFKVMFNITWIAMEGEPVEPGSVIKAVDNPDQSTIPSPGVCGQSLNGQYGDISLPQSSDVTVDFQTYWEGSYRTLIFFDNRPLTFTIDGTEQTALYWKNNGEQMLEVPFTLPESSHNKTNVFAITIPIVTPEEEVTAFPMTPQPIRVTLS